jgi:hypothetical protein
MSVEGCQYCSINTAGGHQPGCPFFYDAGVTIGFGQPFIPQPENPEIASLRAELEREKAEHASDNAVRHAEKKILIDEIAAHAETKRQWNAADYIAKSASVRAETAERRLEEEIAATAEVQEIVKKYMHDAETAERDCAEFRSVIRAMGESAAEEMREKREIERQLAEARGELDAAEQHVKILREKAPRQAALEEVANAARRLNEAFIALEISYGPSIWTTSAGYCLRPAVEELRASLAALEKPRVETDAVPMHGNWAEERGFGQQTIQDQMDLIGMQRPPCPLSDIHSELRPGATCPECGESFDPRPPKEDPDAR